MTTTTAPGYDLATLQQARADSPLEVRHGLATTYQWVARAQRGLDTAIAADGRVAQTVTDLLNGLGPGQRATLRALLEDAQDYLAGHPDVGARGLTVSPRGGTGATIAVRGDGVALRLDRAHAALVGAGDRLVAVRRRPSVYVLVVRGGTVLAAIRATPAPGMRPEELRRRLPALPRRA